MYFVYTLLCFDGHLYVGCTKDLNERLSRHQNKKVPVTAGRLPVRLINYTFFDSKYKAFEFEKYLKTGSGRAFINKHFI